MRLVLSVERSFWEIPAPAGRQPHLAQGQSQRRTLRAGCYPVAYRSHPTRHSDLVAAQTSTCPAPFRCLLRSSSVTHRIAPSATHGSLTLEKIRCLPIAINCDERQATKWAQANEGNSQKLPMIGPHTNATTATEMEKRNKQQETTE